MYSSIGYSNGHHHHHQPHQQERERMGGGLTSHKDRARRGGRRSRDSLRASEHQQQQQQQQQNDRKPATPCTDFDVAYFHSYAHVGIHEEMIKDRVRTETYRAAIMQNQSFIEGKVVVDVGCGTGILSIFCAQAGAKRVYAVDASDIAVQANEVVKANNLTDKVIVLHGRVEDVEIDEEVDVIISEWMGYMLLYESMLGSVITARDRWLKRGGLILPSYATLYMAPVTHPDRYSESIDFWRNVYGIDMSAMMPLAKQCAFEEPSVETITGENVLTWPHVVKHVDCYTIQIHELESIATTFKFKSMMRAPLHGFAFWFDVEFSTPAISPANNHIPPVVVGSSNNHPMDGCQKKKRANPNEALVLSTAPEDPPTHWQQTMIYFYDPIEVEQDQLIEGSVVLSQSKENARFMNIHLEYASGGRSFVKESVMR
ncbi:putative protein arginine N-methyltransferase 6 [Citrus sinensis]|uniref:Uncharacterized protein n=4 Tax=Citrus TaxID=2706 RepID=A0ACB8LEF9_CITSI|nr:probable protein arginine N-methyltransferase 6 [Citrus x clementina]XP_006484479.1 probable protein arginine N-methyltransferase 6 [Citrus sinensis]ESR50894.1 hypothetical protein CICLE_v10031618mg [Citrus x clementina]KAH9707381.1 putative protein arginine N-methyltransferase 6 [Citrus sinensis]KAH9771821.1 putative protein arginine N-methyltransferase 6 [Citrus sinensis]KDO69940.1 hypothetical protein CISIN_1g014247mg [Citrus sinensis]